METSNTTSRYLDKFDAKLVDKSRAAYLAIRDYKNELHSVVHGHLPVDEYNAHHDEIECMLDELDNIYRKFAKFYYTPNPLSVLCATRQ